MKRRAMLALLAAAAAGAWPRALAAQARARLGYLSGGRRADNEENTIGVLRDSLKDTAGESGKTSPSTSAGRTATSPACLAWRAS